MDANPFDIQIASAVTEIGQAAWDHLAGSKPFASYRWYHFGETVLKDESPLYILLLRQGEPIARATFWLKRKEVVLVSSPLVRRVIERVLRRWPLLVCCAPLAETSGLVLPDPPLRDTALTTIIRVVQELAGQHRVSFLLFDYLNGYETGWSCWPKSFMPTVIPDPGTRLVITWPNFDLYLKQLPKSVRSDYRRHCNRAADLDIKVNYHPAVTQLDEALSLILNVETRHKSHPKPWARLMLTHAGMVDATWLTAGVNGHLAACGLLLGDGDFRFLTLLGRNYNVDYAYFQLVYASIRRAIEDGTRVLRGGSGAYELKRRLGFELENDNHAVFTAPQRGVRWMVRRFVMS